MKKLVLSLILFSVMFLSVHNIHADEYSDAMVKTIKKLDAINDISDRAAVTKVRGDFERILQLKKNTWMVNYYMAMCDLLTAWSYMDAKDNDNIKKYNESCIDLLNKATDAKDDFAEAYVLKMSAQANRWIYEPAKMNDIIAKSSEAKEIAKQKDPNNPRFYLIDGMNTYYTPENFGGGVDAAMPLFEKSWELYGTFKPVDETYPTWGKDQAAGMLALVYLKKDKPDEAKKWIDKGLEARPESGFIKNMVMPEYEKSKR